MGLDCGHLKVDWEPRAARMLYNFWQYLTEDFAGSHQEGFGRVESYTRDELCNHAQKYAQKFEASPEIDQWIEGLFVSGDEWVTLIWKW